MYKHSFTFFEMSSSFARLGCVVKVLFLFLLLGCLRFSSFYIVTDSNGSRNNIEHMCIGSVNCIKDGKDLMSSSNPPP
jgi:hypothetical protein